MEMFQQIQEKQDLYDRKRQDMQDNKQLYPNHPAACDHANLVFYRSYCYIVRKGQKGSDLQFCNSYSGIIHEKLNDCKSNLQAFRSLFVIK